MKGDWGGGLFVAVIVIPSIILIVGIMAFYTIASGTEKDACKRDTIDKIANWLQKMELAAATTFEDSFFVSSVCIEHIEKDGIKFKDQEKPVTFGGPPITFVFNKVDRVSPQEALYRVVITPSDRTVGFLALL